MRWTSVFIFVIAASALALMSPHAKANKPFPDEPTVEMGFGLVEPEASSCVGGYCGLPPATEALSAPADADQDGSPDGVEKPSADKNDDNKEDKKVSKDDGDRSQKDKGDKDKNAEKDFKVIDGEQTTCPVTGAKVNKKLYVDHDGYRIYFCCTGCVETFKKDPDKWMKKLEKDGVKLARIDKKSDKDADAGQKKDKDKKSDEDEAEKEESEDELKTQTTCPIMMVDIKKRFYVDHEGKRYYFCCNACVSQFKRNPEKWIKKLEEMGQKPVDIPDDE